MKYTLVSLAMLLTASLLGVQTSVAEENGASKDANTTPSVITVYRSPTCGCCKNWLTHLRNHGFTVEDHTEADMTPIKDHLGVPGAVRSCHTATIDGYLIEGHVPATDIRRLLTQRPQIKGLAVPGMVVGSPGMEMGNRKDPYTVVSIGRHDELRVFREYRDY